MNTSKLTSVGWFSIKVQIVEYVVIDFVIRIRWDIIKNELCCAEENFSVLNNLRILAHDVAEVMENLSHCSRISIPLYYERKLSPHFNTFWDVLPRVRGLDRG